MSKIRHKWHHVTLLLERTKVPLGNKFPKKTNLKLRKRDFQTEIGTGLKYCLDLMLLIIDETMTMKEEIIQDRQVFKGDLLTKRKSLR